MSHEVSLMKKKDLAAGGVGVVEVKSLSVELTHPVLSAERFVFGASSS